MYPRSEGKSTSFQRSSDPDSHPADADEWKDVRDKIALIRKLLRKARTFVEQVYIPDLLAIGGFYKDWLYGGGLSGKSMLSYGDIPRRANDTSSGNLLLPRGGAALLPPEADQDRVVAALVETTAAHAAPRP